MSKEEFDLLKRWLEEETIMIKYVRTGLAIYKIEDNNLIFNSNKIPVDINKLEKDCKVADTIEELCDVFVSIHKTWEYPIIIEIKQASINYTKECAKRGEQVIYGAIWTSKGLIYIAKLNEKGELELI